MKRWALALALFAFSCGGTDGSGGGVQGHITLSIKGDIKAEYFSKVFLRVSYPEGGPYEEERVGRFMPGDEVVFNLDLPEGKERTLEVFLFDQEGRPVYYRSLFLPELSKKDRIRIELLPSQKSLESFEIRSEGVIKTDARLELLSEDLYSFNGFYEGYLVGRAVREGRSVFYVDDTKDKVVVELEREHKLVVSSQIPLYITGSAEGFVKGSVELSLSSSKLTSQDESFLCAVEGSAIWYSISKGQNLELTKACEGSACTAYTINAPQSFSLVEPLVVYKGIACVGGYLEAPNRVRLLDLPQAKKYLGFYYVSDQPCKVYGSVYMPLENLDFSMMPYNVPSFSSWRVYSEDRLYDMSAFCFDSSGSSLLLLPSYRGKLFVEKLEGDKVYGKPLDPKGWSWKGEDIKEVNIKETEDMLFFSFELVGDFKTCDLRLLSEKGEVYIRGIPAYRRHIKLSKRLFVGLEDPRYEFTCYFEGGYVKRIQARQPTAEVISVHKHLLW